MMLVSGQRWALGNGGHNSGDRQEGDVRQGALWAPMLPLYNEQEQLFLAEVWVCECSPGILLRAVAFFWRCSVANAFAAVTVFNLWAKQSIALS